MFAKNNKLFDVNFVEKTLFNLLRDVNLYFVTCTCIHIRLWNFSHFPLALVFRNSKLAFRSRLFLWLCHRGPKGISGHDPIDKGSQMNSKLLFFIECQGKVICGEMIICQKVDPRLAQDFNRSLILYPYHFFPIYSNRWQCRLVALYRKTSEIP